MSEICMYGEEVPQDEVLPENECDCYQIGGMCTEENCAWCVNHSGFCPVNENPMSMEDLDQLIYGGWDDYKYCE